jgi:K+-sensing histidine kinase KdpD
MTQGRGNPGSYLGLSLAVLLALGVVDYLTAFELDLFLFYSVPVAITAWVAGRWPAVGAALLAVGVWVAANLLQVNPYSSPFYAGWNTALRCGWILIVALAVARIRADLDRERRLNADLAQALNQVRELQALLPICAWCKKIRNDEGYWEQLESYLQRTTRTQFTHGVCPACKVRLLDEAGGHPT